MKNKLLGAAALCTALAIPIMAEAAEGYSTANVNMRSGPSTAYPAVTVIPAGAPLTINGCLSETPWCDVSFYGGRGWVAGRYVQVAYQQRRVYVGPEYYAPLGIPIVGFDIDNYWGRYYQGRDFYHDRDRWRNGSGWARQRDDWRGYDDRGDQDWRRRHDRNGDWANQPDRNQNWNGQPDWNRRANRNRDGNRQADDAENNQGRANGQPFRSPLPPNADDGPYSPGHTDPVSGCDSLDCRPSPRGSNR